MQTIIPTTYQTSWQRGLNWLGLRRDKTAVQNTHPSVIELPSGRHAKFCPITAVDDHALRDIFHHMSPHSRFMRYHQLVQQPSEKWLRQAVTAVAHLSPERGFGLLATVTDGRIVPTPAGAAYCIHEATDRAEFAIGVRDDFQGMGIGKQLMHRLANTAVRRGLHSLTATILQENIGMQRVVEHLPFQFTCRSAGDTFEISLDLRSSKAIGRQVHALSPFDMARPFFQ